MKKTKFAVLPLILLAMTACTGRNNDSISSSSETPIAETSTSTSSALPSSSTPTSSSSSSSEAASPSSSSVDIYTTTLWKKAIVDLMIKYMDSNIIPYVDMGKVDGTWVDATTKTGTYLSVSGMNEFDSSKLATIQKDYEDAGYTVTASSSSLTCVKDAIKVVVGKDSSGYWDLKAYYDCPYDKTKAPTAWDTDTANEIAADIDGITLPYVYLGSPVCYPKFTSSSKTLTIYGYKFDEQILTDAKTAYQADGWTITEASGTVTAVKDFADKGDTVTVKWTTPSATATTRYYMTVSLAEVYDPEGITDWPTDVQNTMKADMDNHVPTFFYLGTKSPTISSFNTTYSRYTITGGTYDSRIIPAAKATLSAAGWTCEDTVGTYGTGLKATYEEADGCELTVTIDQPYSETSKVYAYLYFYYKLDIPAGATDWDSDTLGEINAQLGGNTIPYVYLGDTDTTATFNNSYARLSITTATSGTFVTPKIVTNAEKVFAADGWTVTSTKGTYGDNMTAEKSFANGDKIIATLNSTTPTSKAYLYLQYIEAFDATHEGTWYDDIAPGDTSAEKTTSTGYSMKTNNDGHLPPYVYLGAKNHNSSNTNGVTTIYGGPWNTQIIPLAEAKFAADTPEAEGDSTWAIEDNAVRDVDGNITSAATEMTATRSYADGCQLICKITKPSDGTTSYPVYATKMTVTYRSPWNPQATEWSSAVQTNFTGAGFPSQVVSQIPYCYLGTDTPDSTKTTSSYGRYVQIKGKTFDERVLTEFRTAYASWDIIDGGTRYGKDSLFATKEVTYTNDAGETKTGYIRASVYRWSNSDSAVAAMRIFYDEKVEAPSTSTAWSASDATTISSYIGNNTLPYFYIGNTVAMTESTSNGGYLQIKTSGTLAHNHYYTMANAKIFENDGYTVDFKTFLSTGDPTYYGKFTATKKFADGSSVNIDYTPTTTSVTVKVYYNEAFSAPTGTAAAWDSTTTTAMEEKLNSYVLPYFYMGAKEPAVTKYTASTTSSKVLSLKGSTWDDAIINNVTTALTADTEATWTFGYDYSTYLQNGAVYVANGVRTYQEPAVMDEDGTTVITPAVNMKDIITVKVYHDTAANGTRPIVDIYIISMTA